MREFEVTLTTEAEVKVYIRAKTEDEAMIKAECMDIDTLIDLSHSIEYSNDVQATYSREVDYA